MKIFLDPGHGGADSGAVGPTGLRESSVALAVVREAMRRLVAAGHDVEVSRDWDYETRDLATRARASNEWGADVFVSIHCNAATNPAARGIEAWTTPGQSPADPLADRLLAAFGRAFPTEPMRLDKSDGDGDKESKFHVLVHTHAPAVLVEMGFITYPPTETAMRTTQWISTAAGAVVTGIDNWIHGIAKGASA
jgi:N-acetylmuramoyl-L-alanine amidase